MVIQITVCIQWYSVGKCFDETLEVGHVKCQIETRDKPTRLLFVDHIKNPQGFKDNYNVK